MGLGARRAGSPRITRLGRSVHGAEGGRPLHGGPDHRRRGAQHSTAAHGPPTHSTHVTGVIGVIGSRMPSAIGPDGQVVSAHQPEQMLIVV